MPRARHRWVHLLNFAIHAAVGTGLFIVLGVPAVFLDFVIRGLTQAGVSPFPLAMLELVEHVILVFDGAAAVVYIGVTTMREMRRILHD